MGWTPRQFNREADDLANGRVHAFDPALEVKFDPRDLGWHILPHALVNQSQTLCGLLNGASFVLSLTSFRVCFFHRCKTSDCVPVS